MVLYPGDGFGDPCLLSTRFFVVGLLQLTFLWRSTCRRNGSLSSGRCGKDCGISGNRVSPEKASKKSGSFGLDRIGQKKSGFGRKLLQTRFLFTIGLIFTWFLGQIPPNRQLAACKTAILLSGLLGYGRSELCGCREYRSRTQSLHPRPSSPVL